MTHTHPEHEHDFKKSGTETHEFTKATGEKVNTQWEYLKCACGKQKTLVDGAESSQSFEK